MKLIIDIPESEYMEIKRYYDNLPMYSTVEAELYYIAHGTPLYNNYTVSNEFVDYQDREGLNK